METIKIKPLKWKKLPNSYIADTPFGFYKVDNERNWERNWNWQWEFCVGEGRTWWNYDFESLEACKEDAEKHWIVRIQEAMESIENKKIDTDFEVLRKALTHCNIYCLIDNPEKSGSLKTISFVGDKNIHYRKNICLFFEFEPDGKYRKIK